MNANIAEGFSWLQRQAAHPQDNSEVAAGPPATSSWLGQWCHQCPLQLWNPHLPRFTIHGQQEFLKEQLRVHRQEFSPWHKNECHCTRHTVSKVIFGTAWVWFPCTEEPFPVDIHGAAQKLNHQPVPSSQHTSNSPIDHSKWPQLLGAAQPARKTHKKKAGGKPPSPILGSFISTILSSGSQQYFHDNQNASSSGQGGRRRHLSPLC